MSVDTELTRAAQNAASVNAAKAAIASAITAKGGTVGASDGLADFPTAIAGIPSGGGIVKTKIGTFHKDVQNQDQTNIAAIDIPAGLSFDMLEFVYKTDSFRFGKAVFYNQASTGSQSTGIVYYHGKFYATAVYAFYVQARESADAPLVIGFTRIGGMTFSNILNADYDVYAWTMPYGA